VIGGSGRVDYDSASERRAQRADRLVRGEPVPCAGSDARQLSEMSSLKLPNGETDTDPTACGRRPLGGYEASAARQAALS